MSSLDVANWVTGNQVYWHSLDETVRSLAAKSIRSPVIHLNIQMMFMLVGKYINVE